jgi:hypothetical protein
MKTHTSNGWLLGLVLSILISVALGLTLVWYSIERTDIAYHLRKLRADVEDAISHRAKLEVERDYLISPSELRKMAARLNMHEAKPGQIRRVAPESDTTTATR